MMEKPQIANKAPILKEMEAGTYYWCACGKSGNQPFCDGSHKDTLFTPMKVEIEQDKKVFWCTCKQTGNAPFCDGSHKNL